MRKERHSYRRLGLILTCGTALGLSLSVHAETPSPTSVVDSQSLPSTVTDLTRESSSTHQASSQPDASSAATSQNSGTVVSLTPSTSAPATVPSRASTVVSSSPSSANQPSTQSSKVETGNSQLDTILSSAQSAGYVVKEEASTVYENSQVASQDYQSQATTASSQIKAYTEQSQNYEKEKAAYETYQADMANYERQIKDFKDYVTAEKAYQAALVTYEKEQEKYQTNQKINEKLTQEFEAKQAAYKEKLQQFQAALTTYEKQIAAQKAAEQSYQKQEAEYQTALAAYMVQKSDYDKAKKKAEQAQIDYQEKLKIYGADLTKYEEAREVYDAEKMAEFKAEQAYQAQLKTYQANLASYQAQKAQYDQIKADEAKVQADYHAKLKAYEAQLKTYQLEKAKYDQAKLDEAKLLADYEKEKQDYQEKLKAYQLEKTAYDEKMAELKAKTKKDGALSQVQAQHLIFKSEPHAKVTFSDGINFMAASVTMDRGLTALSKNADNLATQVTPHLSLQAGSGTPAGAGDGYGLILEKGQTITVTYDGLEKSSYNGRKIAKVVYTYQLTSTFASNNKATAFIYTDPTRTIYVGTQGQNAGQQDFNIHQTIAYYYEDGSQISFSPEASALLSFASRNHTYKYGEQEYVRLGQGLEFIQITGSSVTGEDGFVAARNSNDAISEGSKYDRKDWDKDGNLNEYYGAGAAKITGKTIAFDFGIRYIQADLDKDPANSSFREASRQWFSVNSDLKAEGLIDWVEPKVPTAPVAPNLNLNLKAPTAPTKPTEPQTSPIQTPLAPTKPQAPQPKNLVAPTAPIKPEAPVLPNLVAPTAPKRPELPKTIKITRPLAPQAPEAPIYLTLVKPQKPTAPKVVSKPTLPKTVNKPIRPNKPVLRYHRVQVVPKTIDGPLTQPSLMRTTHISSNRRYLAPQIQPVLPSQPTTTPATYATSWLRPLTQAQVTQAIRSLGQTTSYPVPMISNISAVRQETSSTTKGKTKPKVEKNDRYYKNIEKHTGLSRTDIETLEAYIADVVKMAQDRYGINNYDKINHAVANALAGPSYEDHKLEKRVNDFGIVPYWESTHYKSTKERTGAYDILRSSHASGVIDIPHLMVPIATTYDSGGWKEAAKLFATMPILNSDDSLKESEMKFFWINTYTGDYVSVMGPVDERTDKDAMILWKSLTKENPRLDQNFFAYYSQNDLKRSEKYDKATDGEYEKNSWFLFSFLTLGTLAIYLQSKWEALKGWFDKKLSQPFNKYLWNPINNNVVKPLKKFIWYPFIKPIKKSYELITKKALPSAKKYISTAWNKFVALLPSKKSKKKKKKKASTTKQKSSVALVKLITKSGKATEGFVKTTKALKVKLDKIKKVIAKKKQTMQIVRSKMKKSLPKTSSAGKKPVKKAKPMKHVRKAVKPKPKKSKGKPIKKVVRKPKKQVKPKPKTKAKPKRKVINKIKKVFRAVRKKVVPRPKPRPRIIRRPQPKPRPRYKLRVIRRPVPVRPRPVPKSKPRPRITRRKGRKR